LPKKHTLWRYLILLLVASLAYPAASANAENLAFVEIGAPDTDKFPIVSTYLDAFDNEGNFISDLSVSNVAILENGQQIIPATLEKLVTPMDFILAINSDPALAIRDANGISRYDNIKTFLINWAAARPNDSLDRLALVWNGGVIGSRLSPADWKTRLDTFDPNPRNSTNNLAALAFALDTAQQSEIGHGVKKSILLISGHLGVKDQNGINELINRAKANRVRVYVWITDSKSFQDNPGALALQELALATGGRYTIFSGNEILPDPEEWLSGMRSVYQFTYNSNIRAPGKQTLSVQINKGDLALSSPAVDFTIEIQPPSVALLSVPIQITRQNPESPFDLASFKPTQQEISALVEFPDGRTRALEHTALYVDNQKIAENTAEPFNRFNWDLSKYEISGDHLLQVEAEDVLGLSSMSAEVPVQVTVVQPPGGVAGLILRNRTAVTISFIVMAGAVVLGIIVIGGRRGLASLAERRKKRAAQRDPVTQPIPSVAENKGNSRANPFPWLRRKTETPPAYLVRLTSEGVQVPGERIPLLGREITFGTDPTQATIVLDHASVSPLHSRLRRSDDGVFRLLDQSSVAGTWINYEMIPSEGLSLKHGDVIHFGMLTYRFNYSKPLAISKPIVTPIKKA